MSHSLSNYRLSFKKQQSQNKVHCTQSLSRKLPDTCSEPALEALTGSTVCKKERDSYIPETLLHTLQDPRGFSETRQRGMQLLWAVRGLLGPRLHVIWASSCAVGWTTPGKALETGQAWGECGSNATVTTVGTISRATLCLSRSLTGFWSLKTAL